MRRTIIAGNWKMNNTVPEGLALIEALKPLLGGHEAVETVVCPPYTALYPVREALQGSQVVLGAQGVFWKDKGAYTSFISPLMLSDLSVQYVIIGHSETRGRFGVAEADITPDLMMAFGETDAGVNIKAKAVLKAGLRPIICVGETLQERQSGQTDAIVAGQVRAALDGLSSAQIAESVVFAYEPVWAIGTGEVCAADEADRVCGVVRAAIASVSNAETAEAVRIQYGGSMKPDNAADLLSRPNIDGGLIGGASLKAADFAAIVAAAG